MSQKHNAKHSLATQRHYSILMFTAIAVMLLNACNPAKKLNEGQYLLIKNKILDKDTKLDNEDIETYIRPKPNYKLLGLIRFHLWLHNRANEKHIQKKRTKYDAKIAERNRKRSIKGKKPKKNDHTLFGEWLLNIGEEPVIYDSTISKKTNNQIKLFLKNKGYFNSSVSDSVKLKRNGKAKVYYTIKATPPHTIDEISYTIPDNTLQQIIFRDTINSLIKSTENFDLYTIEKERNRIAYMLNNEGYYLFTKEHVYFNIDTNEVQTKANIKIGIKNYHEKSRTVSDSINESPHKRFVIDTVFIQTEKITGKVDTRIMDTTIVGDYVILHPQKLKHKTKVLLNAIFIRKNEVYQFKNVESTYKLLSELKAFKNINIVFQQVPGNKLKCYIQLQPILKQAVTLETEGTNSSGNLGVSGSVVYQNRNLIKGAELLEIRLKGGISAQTPLNDASQDITSFNTIEFGPELNLYIPRFLLPFKVEAWKHSNPKTIFTSGYNYQRRSDYQRTITNFALGYTWKESAKKTHKIHPFTIDFVKVDLEPSFKKIIDSPNQSKFIRNSFSNHLTTSTRYSFTFNGQNAKNNKDFSFFRGTFESSGNILRGAYNLANSIKPNTFIKDSLGRYTILDIPYSHYLRLDADYRYYIKMNHLGELVLRVAGGIGKPLKNFTVLPFEKSFFSGGANGIRAWQARSLGPGSYTNSNYSFDQFGDGQLEANVEHRFKIFRMLNGAVFVDAGNIWLAKPDETRPGGDFKLDRFYKEIAIGTGVGLRLDFNFFIIRLDLGLKVRDPQFAENDRWVIQHIFNSEWKNDFKTSNEIKYHFTTFNVGVGYPF